MAIYKHNIPADLQGSFRTGAVRVAGVVKPPASLEVSYPEEYAQAMAKYNQRLASAGPQGEEVPVTLATLQSVVDSTRRLTALATQSATARDALIVDLLQAGNPKLVQETSGLTWEQLHNRCFRASKAREAKHLVVPEGVELEIGTHADTEKRAAASDG